MTTAEWTWQDSGILSGRANRSLDRYAYAAAAAVGQLRFYRFTPSVIMGAHEDVERVVRLEYCAQRGIEVDRRLTGGSALYLDNGQLCWSLTMPSACGRDAGETLQAALERFCSTLVKTLRGLGIEAVFKAFNDIEVGGRKIACGFLADDGQGLLFQGSLLLDVDVETMLKALRVPTEKLSAKGMRSARERFTTLREQLGKIPMLEEIESRIAHALGVMLGVSLVPSSSVAPVRDTNHPVCPDVMEWSMPIDTFRAFHCTAGGVLHAAVTLGSNGAVIKNVHISGSIHMRPPDLLHRLERTLTAQNTGQLNSRLEQFLQGLDWEIVGATAQDLGYVLQLAVNRQREQADLGVETAAANMLMVHSPRRDQGLDDILSQATVMLVPYCAKPLWCKWRNRDGCTECGRCEVGEAYRLARERGMQVISINNYEHLCQTLDRMRDERTAAYIGMCCGNFYLKRRVAFDEAGIPAVLMDISGSNCYELRQEGLAYAGTFQAQSQLNIELVRKVTARIPSPKSRKS